MQAPSPISADTHCPSRHKADQGQGGFTAIELMVVVAIVAILAALAAPSFNPLIERWRVRQAAESLTSTFYFARSEAIKRGGGISIDGSAGWNNGWKVTYTQGGLTSVLRINSTPDRLAVDQSNSKTMLYIDRWGMTSESLGGTATGMNFAIYPSGKSPTDSNAIRLCLYSGGRINQSKAGAACP